MASANMHRFVLAQKIEIKIVSIKDILDKEKNPNIRLDAKFFVENDRFKPRGYKRPKGTTRRPRKEGRGNPPDNRTNIRETTDGGCQNEIL